LVAKNTVARIPDKAGQAQHVVQGFSVIGTGKHAATPYSGAQPRIVDSDNGAQAALGIVAESNQFVIGKGRCCRNSHHLVPYVFVKRSCRDPLPGVQFPNRRPVSGWNSVPRKLGKTYVFVATIFD
jgi:hypothetical protein